MKLAKMQTVAPSLSHFGAIEIIDSDGAPDVPGVDHK
jgi:hypothetical protein